MPRRHEIPSTPDVMVWGYLDSSTPPVLEVSSGDIETLPDDLSRVAADYMAALETLPPGPGPHFIKQRSMCERRVSETRCRSTFSM